MTDSSKKPFKVGDKIVEFGQVFRIFKIERTKNEDGSVERVLYFRPFFKRGDNRSMVCSIPENSLGETRIRRPISKTTLLGLFCDLSDKKCMESFKDVNEAKQLLCLNDPFQTIIVLNSLCYEQNQLEDATLPKSKRDIICLATERLIEEFAFVLDISLEKAEQKILSALDK